MGKSTAADMLRRLGVPICDSDQVVHGLLARGGGAVAAVARTFGDVVRDGAVDHTALADRVFNDPAALDFERSAGSKRSFILGGVSPRPGFSDMPPAAVKSWLRLMCRCCSKAVAMRAAMP